MDRAIFVSIALLGLIAFGRAHALSCESVDLDTAYDTSEFVIVSRLVSVEPADSDQIEYSVTFRVSEVLKGDPPSQIVLRARKNPWLKPESFPQGFNYLMFLRPGQTTLRYCDPIGLFNQHSFQWYMNWREDNGK